MGSSAGSYSDKALTLTSQGIALFRQGDLNKSLDSLNLSLTLDPYSQKTWVASGDVLSAMGRLNESLAAYTNGLNLDKADPVLYAKIADVQVKLGAYNTAVASYDHALALQPDFPSAMANRTRAVALASGLVAMATTAPSSQPAGADINGTVVPAASVTLLSPSQTPTKQAPFPALLAVPAAALALMAFRRVKSGKR